MRPSTEPWSVRRARAGTLGEPEDDALAAEEPLEVRLNGASVVVTMRTPGHDAELATGFLVNEGVLRPRGDYRVTTIVSPLDPRRENVVSVHAEPGDVLRAPATRGFSATSACGICGLARIEDAERDLARVDAPLRVGPDVLARLPAAMRDAQRVFDRTGGLHAAALFSAGGDLLALREDVGRHNAVDKATGWALRAGRFPLHDAALLVSGRAGFEVVQKAVASGVPLVAAVGAPSSLAARMAERSGVTLVGFLRDDKFNVYSHPWRLS